MIELLIVIIILTTLVSAAIPILAPSNDDRRLREASRGVNSFISAAQMKAIELRRPFGVALKRLSQDTNTNAATSPNVPHEDNAVCVELFYVEQPAPYRGFDRTSSARIARHTTRSGLVFIEFVVRGTGSTSDNLPVGWDADLFPVGVIRPGDVIEIGGTQYGLLPLTPQTPPLVTSRVSINSGFYQAVGSNVVRIEAQPLNDTGQMLNVEFDDDGYRMRDLASGSNPQAPYWTNPAPYKILRQPMPTSDEPFQMPEGTAIDLRASGPTVEFKNNTASGFFYNTDLSPPNNTNRIDNSDSIIIMFTPEGAVERLRLNQKNVQSSPATDNIYDERTTSNIYLLVGRRENAPPPALSDDMTVDSTRWGALTTEQQKQDAKETVNWLRGESRWIVIGSQSGRVATVENAFVEPGQFFDGASREIIRARQINASREFAREMTQVGGR